MRMLENQKKLPGCEKKAGFLAGVPSLSKLMLKGQKLVETKEKQLEDKIRKQEEERATGRGSGCGSCG